MKTASTTLSLAQLLILSTAAQRPDRMVLPLPATLRARGASQTSLLTSLLKFHYVEEITTLVSELSWRRDEASQLKALRITTAGITILGGNIEPDDAQSTSPVPGVSDIATAAPESKAPFEVVSPEEYSRPGGKLGQVLNAIEGARGATLAELIDLTGWLPHTTRAALTRLRQRGFVPQLVQQDGRKSYRLHTDGAA